MPKGGKKNNNDIPQRLIARYNHLSALADEEALMSGMRSVFDNNYIEVLDSLSPVDNPQFGIYIHLPFCPTRCLNCERNSHITQDSKKIDDYLELLGKEISLVTERIGVGKRINRLHIGGGTPNYLTEPQLAHLVDMVDRNFVIDDATETSIDANPKRASATQLDLLKGLGFKEINYGVRDVNSKVQHAIGRVHSFNMLRDVFDITRNIGFESISMDFMYGLPAQTIESIESSAKKINSLAPDRIDCFAYVRSTSKLPHQIAIDSNLIPSRATKLAQFNEIVSVLTESNYDWIGLECFAAKESNLAKAKLQNKLKRDWIGYTLHPSKNLIGFGVNASSEVGGYYAQNYLDLDNWRKSIEENRMPIQKVVKLADKDLAKRDEIINLLCNPDLTQNGSLLIHNLDHIDTGKKAASFRHAMYQRM